MSSLLPRSRSESTVNVKVPYFTHAPSAGASKSTRGLSVSSSELRSMLINLNTTVPQNLRPENLSTTHLPRPRSYHSVDIFGRRLTPGDMCSCCGIRCVLILLQVFFGAVLTGMTAYVHIMIPAIRLREQPIWAGVPLLLSGLSSIFFCVKGRKHEEMYMSFLVMKTVYSVLSAISIFLCVTAAVFCGIHLKQILTYTWCQHKDNGCLCYHSEVPTSKAFVYSPVENCHVVQCHIKIFISASGSVCVIGSLVTLVLIIHIWKSRYGYIAGGHV